MLVYQRVYQLPAPLFLPKGHQIDGNCILAWQLRHCQSGCWLRHERCLLGFSLSTSYAGVLCKCVSCHDLHAGWITELLFFTKSAGLLIFFFLNYAMFFRFKSWEPHSTPWLINIFVIEQHLKTDESWFIVNNQQIANQVLRRMRLVIIFHDFPSFSYLC